MTEPDSPRKARRVCGFSYALGAGTVLLVTVALLWRAGHKLGWERIGAGVEEAFYSWRGKTDRVLDLPPAILEELIVHQAIIEKAGDPTHSKNHDNFLVQPHDRLGYVLRPDVRFRGDMLKTRKAWNLTPPTLYMLEAVKPSEALATYIRDMSRVHFTSSTDRAGRRSTLPEVVAAKQVLVIGDSVAFGMGVADGETIASHLQRLLGERQQVINAGVGGYDGKRCMTMAKLLLSGGEAVTKSPGLPFPLATVPEVLIYVACQNDFMDRGASDWRKPAAKDLAQLKELSQKHGLKVLVVLHEYVEFFVQDLLREEGWSEKRLRKTGELRAFFPEECEKLGFDYLDWGDLVEAHVAGEKTIYAAFTLYCDHGHLSPYGGRLMAKAIHAKLTAPKP